MLDFLLWLFGWFCVIEGFAWMTLEVVEVFVRLPLKTRPPVGMSVLLLTVGLIALHFSR